MSIANSALATRIGYVRGVQKLILYYNQLPEECSVHQIKSFLSYLKENENYSSSTLNLRVCALKYYFRNIVNRLDLVVSIPNPRVSKFDTEVLSYDELKLLINSCRDIRQKLVITLLYDTGMRVSEVVKIRLCDFDKFHQSITIYNSKGKKTRVVYYGQKLRDVLKQYVAVLGYYPKNTLIESYTQTGEALSKRGVQHIVREVVKRTKMSKKVTPHTLRHSFAVHYLNRGGSIFRLQKLLGHEYITTTLHYLKYAIIPDSSDLSPLDYLI
ncbi:MAG: tyrosine-type recombinase/integrase [Saprospiraceae bacterium]|nr:tyrosine-type recombinase/integrase [Saprospiraceae bacterium]MBP6625500.1 tyrosine-type recombinase/integrase [Chitinophagaceae bacterium]